MKDKKPRRNNDRRNQQKNNRPKERRIEPIEPTESEENNFVFGHHASVEALQAGRGNKLFMQEDAHGDKIDQLKSLAKEQAVPVKWVPKQKLDTLSDGGVHQGIVLGITPYEYLTLDELLGKTAA
ncbi:MAG: RNA methyltransferase substrate-binding domain-containing protein, partial [Enterococcus sp.]